jgi:hypothetical protein
MDTIVAPGSPKSPSDLRTFKQDGIIAANGLEHVICGPGQLAHMYLCLKAWLMFK